MSPIWNPREDMMVLRLFRANSPGVKMSGAKLATIMLAASAAMAFGLNASDANAAPKKKYRTVQTTNGGPNYSYRAGPRTRVYVTRRSWLDAGTEVLPGERKFTDYAYPPGYNYGHSIDRTYQARQPLSSPWDVGGYPERIPLY
jgi:hypothetical protein